MVSSRWLLTAAVLVASADASQPDYSMKNSNLESIHPAIHLYNHFYIPQAPIPQAPTTQATTTQAPTTQAPTTTSPIIIGNFTSRFTLDLDEYLSYAKLYNRSMKLEVVSDQLISLKVMKCEKTLLAPMSFVTNTTYTLGGPWIQYFTGFSAERCENNSKNFTISVRHHKKSLKFKGRFMFKEEVLSTKDKKDDGKVLLNLNNEQNHVYNVYINKMISEANDDKNSHRIVISTPSQHPLHLQFMKCGLLANETVELSSGKAYVVPTELLSVLTLFKYMKCNEDAVSSFHVHVTSTNGRSMIIFSLETTGNNIIIHFFKTPLVLPFFLGIVLSLFLIFFVVNASQRNAEKRARAARASRNMMMMALA